MSEANSSIIESVESVYTGESEDSIFDIDVGAFDDFDARFEDLIWREMSNGTLLVAERQRPNVVVSFNVDGMNIAVEKQSPEDVDWNGARTISGVSSSPQFD